MTAVERKTFEVCRLAREGKHLPCEGWIAGAEASAAPFDYVGRSFFLCP
jgi:hypothetical protein